MRAVGVDNGVRDTFPDFSLKHLLQNLRTGTIIVSKKEACKEWNHV